METKTIIAGISQGDINGIGYEVIIKALMNNL
jgi:4-hydroxy-L-threonine phosphate dehydrogenase PdxA